MTRRFKFSEAKNLEFRTEIFNIFHTTNFEIPASRLSLALPTINFNSATNLFAVAVGIQTGHTGSTAGGTFGLLRQRVEGTVGPGTGREIQFALRLNF